jgi:hypothetical protein
MVWSEGKKVMKGKRLDDTYRRTLYRLELWACYPDKFWSYLKKHHRQIWDRFSEVRAKTQRSEDLIDMGSEQRQPGVSIRWKDVPFVIDAHSFSSLSCVLWCIINRVSFIEPTLCFPHLHDAGFSYLVANTLSLSLSLSLEGRERDAKGVAKVSDFIRYPLPSGYLIKSLLTTTIPGLLDLIRIILEAVSLDDGARII